MTKGPLTCLSHRPENHSHPYVIFLIHGQITPQVWEGNHSRKWKSRSETKETRLGCRTQETMLQFNHPAQNEIGSKRGPSAVERVCSPNSGSETAPEAGFTAAAVRATELT